MDKSKHPLKVELIALANEMQVAIDPATVGQLANLMTPLPTSGNLEGTRDVKLDQTGANEFYGSFRNPKNIFEIDLKGALDIIKTSDKFYGALAVGAITLTPYVLLLGVVKAIYDGTVMKIESKENAKILYALYKLDKRRFTEEELSAAYLAEFKETMTADDWAYAKDIFLQFEIISISRNDTFKLEEKIRVKRKL